MSAWPGLLLGIRLCALAADARPDAPFEVVTSKPWPALKERLQPSRGWTGGDGAYSIPLGAERMLWLWSDSWIGTIKEGRRMDSRMIHNAAAWQALNEPKASVRFFWKTGEKGPADLLRPAQADAWYWPADGALVEDRLYFFCKVVRSKQEGAPGLQFEWFGNDLLQVRNPRDEPTAWKVERYPLPAEAGKLRLGTACLVEGDYLYVYGLFPAAECKPLDQPLGLARIPRRKLAALDGQGWEYWCRGPEGAQWSQQCKEPAPLFQDAAPEMSVSRLRGSDGFLATYTSLGLGRDIMIRHAPRPEGPWSKPLRVYRCPEDDKKLLLYGAKAHPELAEHDGQLVLTYCRNVGSLAEHMRRPDVYFPQVIAIELRPRASRK